MLKASYDLSFTQIGLITLTFQITASLLQPGSVITLTAIPTRWYCPSDRSAR